jgi:hypothetical protein
MYKKNADFFTEKLIITSNPGLRDVDVTSATSLQIRCFHLSTDFNKVVCFKWFFSNAIGVNVKIWLFFHPLNTQKLAIFLTHIPMYWYVFICFYYLSYQNASILYTLAGFDLTTHSSSLLYWRQRRYHAARAMYPIVENETKSLFFEK